MTAKDYAEIARLQAAVERLESELYQSAQGHVVDFTVVAKAYAAAIRRQTIIELHPKHPQPEICSWCREAGR